MGFSSTTGVHISLTRFKQVDYNSEAQTVSFGAGLIWDDIYAVLEPFNVTVVGGRISSVGAAGFTLGGGVSRFLSRFVTIVFIDLRIFFSLKSIWADSGYGHRLRVRQTGRNRK